MSNNVFLLYVDDELVGEAAISPELFLLKSGYGTKGSIRTTLDFLGENVYYFAPSLRYNLTLCRDDECWRIVVDVREWQMGSSSFGLVLQKATQSINDKECLKWCPMNNIYEVDGVDLMNDIRNAIM